MNATWNLRARGLPPKIGSLRTQIKPRKSPKPLVSQKTRKVGQQLFEYRHVDLDFTLRTFHDLLKNVGGLGLIYPWVGTRTRKKYLSLIAELLGGIRTCDGDGETAIYLAEVADEETTRD